MVNLSIYITTLCNLHCEWCCAETQTKGNITIKQLQKLSTKKYNQLTITGGEPTLHKKFREVINYIVSNFAYNELILATNGCGVKKHIDLMDHFQTIRFSRYDKADKNHKENNSKTISDFIKTYTGTARIFIRDREMLPTNNKTKPCGRTRTLSYFKGKIYGCCVAAGMENAIGKPISKEWNNFNLPCKECVFAW